MDEIVREQYEIAPAGGLKRFWMGWYSWAEDYPEAPFPFWQSGTGMQSQLKPSMREEALAKGLPEQTNFLDSTVSDEDSDTFYHGLGIYVGMIDAVDPAAAWALLREAFPDARDRDEDGTSFCKERPEQTLATLKATGRFSS